MFLSLALGLTLRVLFGRSGKFGVYPGSDLVLEGGGTGEFGANGSAVEESDVKVYFFGARAFGADCRGGCRGSGGAGRGGLVPLSLCLPELCLCFSGEFVLLDAGLYSG